VYAPPLATEKLPAGKIPAGHPASPVQRALDESPKVTAQQAVASRLAHRRASGVVQREGNGLAEPAAIAAYALPLAEQMAKAGPGERVALLRDAINSVLTKSGVPPVEIAVLDQGDSAHFDETTWTMSILRESLASADPGILAELVGTVYHEARHAEQYFRVAQQAAAASDETGLFRHKLPPNIREAAVQSKGEFAKLGEATKKATTEWSESLKNPRAVLDPMEDAGRALAAQFELYSKSLQVLLVGVRMLSLQLGTGELESGAVSETASLLTNHREEETRLTHAAKLYRTYLIAYRRMPHEQDAHLLGWTVEDTFRTGKAQVAYNPQFANRVPDDDTIWGDLALLDSSLDRLQDLLEALQKLAATSSFNKVGNSDDEEDFDFEEPVEDRAKRIAEMIVKQKSTLSYEVEYLKILEQLKKADQEKASAASDLSALTGAEKLGVLADALGRWTAIEPRYLAALSAKIHRRTNI
jgi:hypothetical protein